MKSWFCVPNNWTDITCKITSLAELKVIEYVLRHTWGYGEHSSWEMKRISTDEFSHGRKRQDGTRIDRGTGLSNKSVFDGLKRAVENDYLTKYIDNTDLGRIAHYYQLRMEGDTRKIIYAMNPNKKGSSPWKEISKETKKRVYKRSGGVCSYCGNKSKKWHFDHILPSSRGGPDSEDNLALACPPCNMAKQNKTPDEWERPVFYYVDGAKKIYQGWVRFYKGPSKESKHPPLNNIGMEQRNKPKIDTNRNTMSKLSSSDGKRSFPSSDGRKGKRTATPWDHKATAELHKVVSSHIKVNCTANNKQWANQFSLMRTRDKVPKRDIRSAIEWYKDNIGSEYMVEAFSASTFRKKYMNGQIPAAMKRNGYNNASNLDDPRTELQRTVDRVLEHLREDGTWHGDYYDPPEQSDVDRALVALGKRKGEISSGDCMS